MTALSVVATVALAGSVLTVPAAQAADGSAFNPGNIISDAVFYDGGALSAAQIQSFIDSQVRCQSGYTCLSNYRQATFSRPADAMCRAYTGSSSQRASDIIWNVSQACGISPKVLLVLLQKEQGLVTNDAPSATRFERATGYACPDTAPCDAQFFGFYNQVYKAAWQFQRYRLNPGGYGYRAGRVNTILYHPDAACGTSQVFIDNQATAGLYIYTPYRPNAAALANLYGTGDGCSAYGNRNFWRIFTDWFGSTQAGGSFVKTATDPTVYLVSGTRKHPVPSIEILQAYSALGTYSVVSAEALARLTTARPLGALVRDAATGEIFYSDLGVRHYVSSCALLTEWGTSCSEYVDLTSAQIKALRSGTALGTFARSAATGAIFFVNDGIKRWVHSAGDIVALARGGSTDYADLGPTALATLKDGPDYLTPGLVVFATGQSARYLLGGSNVLYPLSPAALGAELTSTPPVEVAPATIRAMTVGQPLSVAVTCGTTTYVAGGGSLWKLRSNSSGLTGTPLDSAACAALPQSRSVVEGQLFVRSPSTGAIYHVTLGTRSYQSTIANVLALNGGSMPVLVPMGEEVLATIPSAAPAALPSARLVKSASSPAVALVDGTRRIPIDSFEIAAEFGVTGYSVVGDEILRAYPPSTSSLTLTVTCGSERFVAGGGRIWPVTSDPGLPTTALSSATCQALTRSGSSVGGRLFLRSPTSGAIYSITGGRKLPMVTMDQVYASNGGVLPTLVPVGDRVLATIPDDPAALRSTELAKSATADTVFMIDGAAKIPIDRFETAAEFGITGYRVVPDSVLGVYAPASAPLSIVVRCGTELLIAGGGKLNLLSSGSSQGLPVTTLDSRSCASLQRSSIVVPGALFLRSPSTGAIYAIDAGRKVYLSSIAQVQERNGGSLPTFIPVSEVVLSLIPG